VEMLPLGVLTGRLLDQYGDPVRHAMVSTLAKDRDPRRGEDYSSLFASTTDDRGEYRIANMEPGSAMSSTAFTQQAPQFSRLAGKRWTSRRPGSRSEERPKAKTRGLNRSCHPASRRAIRRR
jgi:protocatechuate 3,4-dioxygenase beta subunit